MNPETAKDREMFQFLAEKLMARGNPSAYSEPEWEILKGLLQQPAFF